MNDEHKPLPDLREVMERARRLDPSAVDELFGEEQKQANVLELVPRDDGPSACLEAFLDGVRADVDERASQRALQSIPAPPAIERRRPWAFVGAAAAAACLFALGAYGMTVGSSGSSVAQAVEAPMTATSPDQGIQISPPSSRPPRAQQVAEVVEVVEAPQAPKSVPSTPVAEPEPAPKSTAAVAQPNSRAKAKRKDLDSLELQAQAAWAAGDLALAEKLLRKLIKSTSSRSRREQAYGDLLSLLELRGNQARTQQMWRSYLRKYPRGRYADDLQARICRSEGTSACWGDYLKKHPKGAHRREAESSTRP